MAGPIVCNCHPGRHRFVVHGEEIGFSPDHPARDGVGSGEAGEEVGVPPVSDVVLYFNDDSVNFVRGLTDSLMLNHKKMNLTSASTT